MAGVWMDPTCNTELLSVHGLFLHTECDSLKSHSSASVLHLMALLNESWLPDETKNPATSQETETAASFSQHAVCLARPLSTFVECSGLGICASDRQSNWDESACSGCRPREVTFELSRQWCLACPGC